MGWSHFATITILIIAALPLAPAVWVNGVGTWARGPAWVAFACALPLMSALFVEEARKSGLGGGCLYYGLAIVCVLGSLVNALINRTNESDHRSDHRKTAIIAAEKASSQRSQWSHGRKIQSQVVGETAVGTLEAELAQVIASDATQWRVSRQCEKPDGPITGAYCTKVAAAKARVEAAKKRDEFDAMIRALDAKTSDNVIVTSVDPFADSLAVGLAAVGIQVTGDGKAILSKAPDWLMALLLELIAAFGPGVVYRRLRGDRREPQAETAEIADRPPPKPAKPANAVPASVPSVPTVPPLTVPSDDPFHVFVATKLERFDGAIMLADEPWQLWRKFCADKGIEAGSQKKFGGKLKTVFVHDRNNKRPRYLNVRAKPAGAGAPGLRLAVSNT